nr:uncharacterized protein LOC124219826 [Neodiprion pinetum]
MRFGGKKKWTRLGHYITANLGWVLSLYSGVHDTTRYQLTSLGIFKPADGVTPFSYLLLCSLYFLLPLLRIGKSGSEQAATLMIPSELLHPTTRVAAVIIEPVSVQMEPYSQGRRIMPPSRSWCTQRRTIVIIAIIILTVLYLVIIGIVFIAPFFVAAAIVASDENLNKYH